MQPSMSTLDPKAPTYLIHQASASHACIYAVLLLPEASGGTFSEHFCFPVATVAGTSERSKGVCSNSN